MRLEIIAEVLASVGLGRIGESIFVHHMPPECREGVMVKTPLTGIEICAELPGYYRGGLQVIVRAQKHERGEEMAKTVLRALSTLQRKEYIHPQTRQPEMIVNQMIPKALPVRYPRSDGNGIEWSINFDCSYVLPAGI